MERRVCSDRCSAQSGVGEAGEEEEAEEEAEERRMVVINM